jgi:hypothetical protein
MASVLAHHLQQPDHEEKRDLTSSLDYSSPLVEKDLADLLFQMYRPLHGGFVEENIEACTRQPWQTLIDWKYSCICF